MLLSNNERQFIIFGYGLSFIFLLLACSEYNRHGFSIVFYFGAILSLIFLILTAIRSSLLQALMVKWLVIVIVLGVIMIAVFLSVFFMIIVIPAALILGWVVKQRMRRRWKQTSSENIWLKLPLDDEYPNRG